MAALADVPWSNDDVRPPSPDADDREITIPWGGWVHERPPARRRSRARAVVGTAGQSDPTSAPSSSTTAAPSSSTAPPLVPPVAPEPTYILVQRLFRFLECERCHVRRRLDRMDQDHQEEDAEAPVQQDAPATTEPPQTHEEPVPQPQPEPEPIVL
ncbi:uncharacterized protein LOC130962771 [Arachis stenosperma]|uniref:uncharacterized protein LOC130962771 n=1 Tax=Arachis stenosperma TaxID=217475 RepID=UPI0025AD2CB5|nr:uncharacterized protein LOC130962771 [Arachis stenosperma]